DSFLRCIDEDWDYPRIDLADASTERINGYLLWIIISYRKGAYTDIKLWECFKEDFEGWTIDTWRQANTTIVREFRDFLRRNGLYVPKNGASIRVISRPSLIARKNQNGPRKKSRGRSTVSLGRTSSQIREALTQS